MPNHWLEVIRLVGDVPEPDQSVLQRINFFEFVSFDVDKQKSFLESVLHDNSSLITTILEICAPKR